MIKVVKEVWDHINTWQKILSIVGLVSAVIILLLIRLDIIKPFWIFWTGVIIVIFLLMIKKEFHF